MAGSAKSCASGLSTISKP